MSRFEISNICTWTKDGVGTKVLEPQRIIDLRIIGFTICHGFVRDGVPSGPGIYWEIFSPRTGAVLLSNY